MAVKRTYPLDITEVCNFRCIFCFVTIKTPKEGGRMSSLDLVADQLVKIKKDGYEAVCFTGGEPTLNPDLPGMVRAANDAGLEAVINTQGMRFAAKSYVRAFGTSNFSCLLSFHSHKKEMFHRITRTKGYERVVQGIHSLLGGGVRVVLSHVLNKHNYKDFPDWVRYVRKEFAPYKGEKGRLISASVFFNQEEDGDGAMVRFTDVRPYLEKGLKGPGFGVDAKTPCTASDCLFIDGFQRDASNFSQEVRDQNIKKLERLPLPRQREQLNYFVAEKCYSCRKFLNPWCKGVRRNYLLAFGAEEFDGLFSPEEVRLIDRARGPESADLPSSPHILLGRTGKEAEKAIPELGRILLSSINHHHRREAAKILGSLGPVLRKAVPLFVRALGDSDGETRKIAAESLFKIDPPPAEIGRALIGLLKDEDPKMRRAAALALGRIVPAPAGGAGALKAALSDSDPKTRGYAALAFTKTRPAQEAAGELREVLEDEDPNVRREAVNALSTMKDPGRKAGPALLRLLKDPEALTRAGAVRALGRVRPRPPRAQSSFLRMLKDSDSRVRLEAASALRSTSGIPPQAVSPFILLLADSDLKVRRTAAHAFADMKKPPRSIAGVLRKALRKEDAELRGAAERALSNIKSLPPELGAA